LKVNDWQDENQTLVTIASIQGNSDLLHFFCEKAGVAKGLTVDIVARIPSSFQTKKKRA